jgi:hypothetical protein
VSAVTQFSYDVNEADFLTPTSHLGVDGEAREARHGWSCRQRTNVWREVTSPARGSPSDDPSQDHHVYPRGCRCRAVRVSFHSQFRLANRFARGPSPIWCRLAHGCNPVWRLAKKLKKAPASTLTIRLGREHERGTRLRTDARGRDGGVSLRAGRRGWAKLHEMLKKTRKKAGP